MIMPDFRLENHGSLATPHPVSGASTGKAKRSFWRRHRPTEITPEMRASVARVRRALESIDLDPDRPYRDKVPPDWYAVQATGRELMETAEAIIALHNVIDRLVD
jgi:hypothetical protein